MSTTRLILTELSAGQAQKHVSVNETFAKLDFFAQSYVMSNSVTAQPASPADGDAYILAATHTGTAWAAMSANDIAHYHGGAWYRYPPKTGYCALVISLGALRWYSGAAWVALTL